MRTFAAILLAATALAQPPATVHPSTTTKPGPNSPVGYWIASHTANDPLALWWDFRSDGTVILNAGAIVDSTYRLSGTTLTLPANEPGAAPGVFDVHFSNDKLYTTAHTDHPPTMEFTRVGPKTNSDSAIVGTWRPSNPPHANDLEQEKLRNRMMNMTIIYGADGSYHVRMPVQSFDGHWDPASHTYKLKPYPALGYQRRGDNLLIALPPDGKQKHIYLPDSVLSPPATP
jgi:hypothetical protein